MSRGDPDSKDEDGTEVRLRFTSEERALLRKACQHYRRSVPVYMRSGQVELVLLDAILDQLEAASKQG